MNKIIRNGARAGLLFTLLSVPNFAQQVKRAAFDVTNYVMDVAPSAAVAIGLATRKSNER